LLFDARDFDADRRIDVKNYPQRVALELHERIATSNEYGEKFSPRRCADQTKIVASEHEISPQSQRYAPR
jgi:hypothetical protein